MNGSKPSARLLYGAVIGAVGGFVIAMLLGNSFLEPVPIMAAGALVGGFLALATCLFDWLAGPPPK